MLVGQMPKPRKECSDLTVPEVEASLEEWFGSPVVLTSSGRGALMLALSQFDLNHYRHRVALPRMISMCVLEAVIHHAFPVDAASGGEADLILLYHQYGFPQLIKPVGVVIEDICHGFFGGVETGRRNWAGQLAAFSISKFFGTSSMVGGIVVHDRRQAEDLRRRRDEAPQRQPLQEDEESHIHCNPQAVSRETFNRMCQSRLLNPRISDRELGGVPKNIAEIAECGRRRRDIIAMYCDAVGTHGYPAGWRDMMLDSLPYFFPVSADEDRLSGVMRRLREIGVEANLYSIDVARNMSAPHFQRMLLVPSHDTIPSVVFADILSTLRSVARNPAIFSVS